MAVRAPLVQKALPAFISAGNDDSLIVHHIYVIWNYLHSTFNYSVSKSSLKPNLIRYLLKKFTEMKRVLLSMSFPLLLFYYTATFVMYLPESYRHIAQCVFQKYPGKSTAVWGILIQWIR